jgi:hypothetical protein
MPARLQLDLTKEHLQELEALMKELGISTKKDLFNQAMTLLEWAVRERKAGRIIASVDEAHNQYKQVLLPAVERVAPRSKNPSELAAPSARDSVLAKK